MRQPQSRHRPRSAIHDTTGTLSRGRTGAPHDGQCDGGWRIDSPFGTRAITTFAKEPTARPRAKARSEDHDRHRRRHRPSSLQAPRPRPADVATLQARVGTEAVWLLLISH